MTTQEFNEVMKNAKNAYKTGVKSPIKLMNILNGQAFKNDEAMKAALKALGATRWTLDLAPRTIAGRQICKLGKKIDDITAVEPGTPVAFVAGEFYNAVMLDTFRGDEFIQICKQKAALELKAANKAQKAADKEAKKAANKETAKAKRAQKAADKKAQKAADKKTSDRRDAIEDMYEMGLINDDQREAMLQALTVEKAA